jgi:hypothetical protein
VTQLARGEIIFIERPLCKEGGDSVSHVDVGRLPNDLDRAESKSRRSLSPEHIGVTFLRLNVFLFLL